MCQALRLKYVAFLCIFLQEFEITFKTKNNNTHFSFFQLNSNLETAAQLNWASGSSSTSFQVGCKYDIDKDATFRVCEAITLSCNLLHCCEC